VLLHQRTWYQADRDAAPDGDGTYDFRAEFASIAGIVSSADLALCHLETPLAPAGGPYAGYPLFSVPPQIADGLAATGFDACSVASNHTWDQGLAGVTRSVDGLAAAGIVPYGAAVVGHPGNPTLIDVDGVRVGLLSYAYGFNEAPQSDAVEVLSAKGVLADAAAARAAGADIVIVSAHWGTEYEKEPNVQQLELAPALLASPDIDLVIGHHAHVVQPFDRIDDKWVAYGLGNMIAAHSTDFAPNEEGVLAEFTFVEDGGRWTVEQGAYLPIRVDIGPPLRVLDLAEVHDPGLQPDRRQRDEEALERTRAVAQERVGPGVLVDLSTP
jgi:poly-gamma-glutamate synthesis protein (capsule biosynthesis protein)